MSPILGAAARLTASFIVRRWRVVAIAAVVGFGLWQSVRADQLGARLEAARAAAAAAQVERTAMEADLRAALRDRDRRLTAFASSEIDASTRSDRACAAEISAAFRRGWAAASAAVAVSPQETPDVSPSSPVDRRASAAAGLREHRDAWAETAYRPGA